MGKTVNASDVVKLVKQALNEKWGYIWGGYGQIHTQEEQDRSTREQTQKWGQKWVGKRVADCSGLLYWAYKELGSYMYHGTNTMWKKYTTAKGKLVKGERDDGQPLKMGCVVFLVNGDDVHHVGVYIGDGEVIEAKGTYYGVIKSSVKSWDAWAELVNTDYGAASDDVPASEQSQTEDAGEVCEIGITLPVLKVGSKGYHTKLMQYLLTLQGYAPGAVDGINGKKTQAALKQCQDDNGLTDNGVCGADTWAVLMLTL